MPRAVIGLCGLAGAGKSMAAARLVEEHDFVRVTFAQPLKAMLRALLTERGVPRSVVDRMVDGDLKSTPAPELGGRTPRHTMQTLGTEWGRIAMSPDLWVHAWLDVARHYTRVVVDDVRFLNEVAAVWDLGGAVYQVVRQGLVRGDHESERHVLDVDGVVYNDGSVDDLHARVDELVR